MVDYYKKFIFWLSILSIFLLIFYKISHVLLPFYIAFFITVLFGGFVEKCEKKFHISKAFTSGIITLLFCLFVVSCLYALFNIGFTKASNSIINVTNDKEIITTISVFIEKILKKFDIENTFNLFAGQFSNLVTKYILLIISRIINYGTNIVNVIFLCILSPIAIFMMLKDCRLIYEKLYLLVPKNHQKEAKNLLNEIYESVFKYIEGQTITAIVLSFCYSAILFFVGLKHFIILGVLIGFSSFIPYVGFYSATTITLFSVYNQFHSIKQMFVTLVLLLLMQIIDCSFITPKIVGNKLKVHPLFIIFGVLASVPLFGFFGIILALPIIGITGVVMKFLVRKYKDSEYYSGVKN